jgi:hypothetical protein
MGIVAEETAQGLGALVAAAAVANEVSGARCVCTLPCIAHTGGGGRV